MENKNNSTNVFWGAILILLGIAFLLDQWNILNAGRFISMLWPLILIALGVYTMSKKPGKIRGPLILISLGIIFLLSTAFSFNVWNLWPIILIVLGVGTLLGWKNNSSNFNNTSSVTSEDKIDDTLIFWGVDKKVKSQSFKGGEVTAIFGGAKYDLTEAKLAENASLNVTAIFGGIEVVTPSNMSVNSNGTGVFGGFTNKVTNNDTDQKLEITGVAVFGGVEIR